MIVDHIYLGKIEPTCDSIVRLFKAVHALRIDSLKDQCCEWIQSNSKDIDDKDGIELLNFTHVHADYKDVNRLLLSEYIVDSWPKIDNLPQFADLFKAITLPEGTNSIDENDAYLFDKVDQETFEVIIDYIYFNITDIKNENVVSVLKASDTFKIEKLVEECIPSLITWRLDKMSSSDVKEILILSLENFQYHEVLNTIYLVQYMMQWPEVDVKLFCSVAYECLENMLLSNDLYFNDPHDLLDICSKWVVHDVENRYRLVLRIAFAISRNREANSDDYCIENPSNWKQCTQDFVKNKIWEVLSSTSVLPFAVFSEDETKKRKTDLPVFVTSHEGRVFRIYSAEWDELVSFRLSINDPVRKDFVFCNVKYPMAATIVKDNLFILCSMCRMSFFYIYSLSSMW
ncbi:uncharacterized protein LOC135848502 isoform X1 [Planococcus citri]|uniref:uncharacterized protein LOC135848502 isoform X1 n=1 Tax=Planococcus citri TaxID=170843 RepID=UPI0031F8D991